MAFAHRGGAAEAPENSWTAFEHAVALGFHYMETDLRATIDGVPVAVHDPNIERVTDRSGPVGKMTWSQLARARLADGRGIPRLEDLLGYWPQLRWNLDVKRREAVGPVVEAIKRTRSEGRVLVAAFSVRRTALARAALGPGVPTGGGRWTVGMLLAAKALPFGHLRTRAAAAQVPVSRKGIRIVDAGFVDVCHRAGVAVHVWTINDAAEMGRLLDLGVDGIMTDRPSVLKRVLCERNQWT
ncbi:MAG: glycerophosphodiester phosphodiesterase [Acidimicrobiales bacterium]